MRESTPRQPKLRASCDRCGATKLKCDRQQPKCGRCISLGAECVYGISKKSNRKPARAKHTELPKTGGALFSSIGFGDERNGPDSGSCQSLPHMLADVTMDDYNTKFTNSVTATEMQDAAAAILSPSLTNFGDMFEDWIFPDDSVGDQYMNRIQLQTPISPTGSPKRQQNMTQISTNYAAQVFKPSDASMAPETAVSPGLSGHNCPREACAIWASLSFDLPLLANAPASPSPVSAKNVPLDHVLRISKEACGRLSALLVCPCARSPHLALLYSSIFSRVLLWYQQAAGCAQSRPRSPPLDNVDLKSPCSSESSSPGVASTQMAVGSFAIDDQTVQSTLKIQLVASEMRKAASVIDLFASQASSETGTSDFCSFGGVGSLYRSVSVWLREEHARTAGILKSKLSDLIEQQDPLG